MLQALTIIGIIGEIAFGLGLFVVFLVPSNQPSTFLKKHRITSGIYMGFVLIGFITFVLHLPTLVG